MGIERNQSSNRDQNGENTWLAAEQRAADKELTGLLAMSARFDLQQHLMHVTLTRGFTVSFSKERSQVMASARDEDLVDVEVQGFGRYIIFSKLDDGFTVESMLRGRFGSDAWERSWAEKHPAPMAA